MLANLPRDTAAEVLLRRALHRAGFRYWKDRRLELGIRCKADVVFPRERVCVFVDGCFWHRCAAHFVAPKTNSAWWEEKIQATVDRDLRQADLLRAHGWTVIRVWEHDVAPQHIGRLVAMIIRSLRQRRSGAAQRLRAAPSN